MTENDRHLIKEAERLCCGDWDVALEMAEKAESEEAREILLCIGHNLYHREEFLSGTI